MLELGDARENAQGASSGDMEMTLVQLNKNANPQPSRRFGCCVAFFLT